MQNIGLVYALLAYFLWGLLPIFWVELKGVDSLQVVMHRMVWSCVLALIFIVLKGQLKECLSVIKKNTIIPLFFSSVLISLNWATFIWAMQNEKISEASMGYFIAPLLSLFLGAFLFKERVRKVQLFSVSLVFFAVLYLIFIYGQPPYLALILAGTFTGYGAIKKTIKVSAVQGMAIETAFMFFPAVIYLVYVDFHHVGVFGANGYTDILLLLAGLFTLLPLLLFSAAAKRLSLTVLGMTQYLGPSIQLLIAVMIYNEPFSRDEYITFGLIWCALIIYSVDQYLSRKKSNIM